VLSTVKNEAFSILAFPALVTTNSGPLTLLGKSGYISVAFTKQGPLTTGPELLCALILPHPLSYTPSCPQQSPGSWEWPGVLVLGCPSTYPCPRMCTVFRGDRAESLWSSAANKLCPATLGQLGLPEEKRELCLALLVPKCKAALY
jgi:hypothetical protein